MGLNALRVGLARRNPYMSCLDRRHNLQPSGGEVIMTNFTCGRIQEQLTTLMYDYVGSPYGVNA